MSYDVSYCIKIFTVAGLCALGVAISVSWSLQQYHVACACLVIGLVGGSSTYFFFREPCHSLLGINLAILSALVLSLTMNTLVTGLIPRSQGNLGESWATKF